jgi:hypothetical protein
MQPFVFGPELAQTVRLQADSLRAQAIRACSHIVSLYEWELWGLRVTRPASGVGGLAREALDPVLARWYPLDRASALGVHFWKLAGGVIELRALAPFDRPPALRFGRLAEADRRLVQEVHVAVERITGEKS